MHLQSVQDLKTEDCIVSPPVFSRKSEIDKTQISPDPLLSQKSGKSSRIRFVGGEKSRQKTGKLKQNTGIDNSTKQTVTTQFE